MGYHSECMRSPTYIAMVRMRTCGRLPPELLIWMSMELNSFNASETIRAGPSSATKSCTKVVGAVPPPSISVQQSDSRDTMPRRCPVTLISDAAGLGELCATSMGDIYEKARSALRS